MVASPQVPTYDKEPQMSADAVTSLAISAIEKRIYSLIVMNYANPDMVGHTGKVDATVVAIQTVDRCLGKLVESVGRAGGTLIITADHGNAEYMVDENGSPWTAHTTNPVPLILIEGEKLKIPGYGANVDLRNDGKLSDIAPTILDILKLPQPPEMTGKSLLRAPEYDLQFPRRPVQVGL